MPPEDDAPTPKRNTSQQPEQPVPQLEAPAPTDTAVAAAPAGLHIQPGSAEAGLILSSLRSVETHALDALAHCAGAPDGRRPRQAPAYEQARTLSAELDMIAQIRTALGSRFVNSRRAEVAAYFTLQAAIWEDQNAPVLSVVRSAG